MKLTFEPVGALVSSRERKLGVSASFSGLAETGAERHVLVADAIGFHIYADLHVTLELSAATEQDKADLFLEVLEDYARIASDFAVGNPKVLIFEVQGERIHLFLNREEATERNVAELIRFSSYFTDAVYAIIKPKIEAYWDGFCMAADFGRAIVLSTGRDGEDSLISLGNAANAPAKRLARSPQLKSGYLAIKADLAHLSAGATDLEQLHPIGDWVEINLRERRRQTSEIVEKSLLIRAIENSHSAFVQPGKKRRVHLAKASEIVKTDSATVDNPVLVQAFLMRADLDGFTLRVDKAFAEGTENAIKRLVFEFLQIMDVPDAFETYLGRPLIRLPWAGDCYCAIFLPKDYEDYSAMRNYLPATLSLYYLDPEGKVNAAREKALACVADRCAWSIGVAGGEQSDGRLLVANIETRHRRFLVVAGWGARRSLDAQNASGLRRNEAAIHDEDYPKLDPNYREAFNRWEDGPTIYRKATAGGLKRAQEKRLADNQVNLSPRRSEIIVPASRPYYVERH
jgi:hypothetical protein